MVNKVILVGNVGADPEVRTFENGNKVARVRIATSERYYNRDTKEKKEHTEWHTLTMWSGLANLAEQYIRKGGQLYIEGRIRNTEWQDSAGTKRYGIEILCDVVNLLGRKGGDSYTPSPINNAPKQTYKAPEVPKVEKKEDPIVGEEVDDDLPF